MNRKEDIFGKTLNELQDMASEHDWPSYTALQISQWLYQKRTHAFSDMTNLPKSTREILGNNYFIGLTSPIQQWDSSDGTRKYLFPVQHGKYVETVYIPDKTRNTLCISTQVGCKMGCVFCMTGSQGFHGNLATGEILNQVVSVPGTEKLSNLVFMGMGEPMDNIGSLLKALEILTSSYGFAMSPSRITVSTIGILPGVKEFLEKSKCHLAVSLNTPDKDERHQLMPVEKRYPVQTIINYLKKQSIARQRRISFEYIMFRGVNDTQKHVRSLLRMLNGLRCRINLIRYHSIPGVSLEASDEGTIQWFKDELNKKGILTTIRASRGQDIMAACGMLSTQFREQSVNGDI